MSEKNNQHYVQKALVNKFATKIDEKLYKICHLDLQTGKAEYKSTGEVFSAKNIYDLSNQEDVKQLENKFNTCIEQPFSSILNKIINTDCSQIVLTRKELGIIRKYFLMQIFRNPLNMAHSENMSPNETFLGQEQRLENETNLEMLKREMLYLCECDIDSPDCIDMVNVRFQCEDIIHSPIIFVKTEQEFCTNEVGYTCERTIINLKDIFDKYDLSPLDEKLKNTYGATNITAIKEELKNNGYNCPYDLCTIFPTSSHTAIIFANKEWCYYHLYNYRNQLCQQIFSSNIVNRHLKNPNVKFVKEKEILETGLNVVRPEFLDKNDIFVYELQPLNLQETNWVNALMFDVAQKDIGMRSPKAMISAIEQYNYYSVILKSKKSYAHFIPQLKKMPELVPIE